MQFRVRSITWIPYGILSWYLWGCIAYKNDNSRFHSIWVIFPWWFQMQFCVRSVTNTLWYIIMALHSNVVKVLTTCPLMVSDAISCPLCNLNTLWYIIMTLYSYEDVSNTGTTTLACILSELFPLDRLSCNALFWIPTWLISWNYTVL